MGPVTSDQVLRELRALYRQSKEQRARLRGAQQQQAAPALDVDTRLQYENPYYSSLEVRGQWAVIPR